MVGDDEAVLLSASTMKLIALSADAAFTMHQS